VDEGVKRLRIPEDDGGWVRQAQSENRCSVWDSAKGTKTSRKALLRDVSRDWDVGVFGKPRVLGNS
jgi:hypothetical protein